MRTSTAKQEPIVATILPDPADDPAGFPSNELRLAIENHSASYRLYAGLSPELIKARGGPPEWIDAARRYAPYIRAAFCSAHGEIIDETIVIRNGIRETGAVAMTDHGEVHIHGIILSSDNLLLADIMYDCFDLASESAHVLKKSDVRQMVTQRLYDITTMTMHKLLDRQADIVAETQVEIIESLRAKYATAQAIYLRAAQREALFQYFVGMLAGIGVLGGAITICSIAMSQAGVANRLQINLICAAIAGGFGAIFSVLSRITSGQLSLSLRAGQGITTFLGAVPTVDRGNRWSSSSTVSPQWLFSVT